MQYDLTFKRESSMSIAEAVIYIKQKTAKRRDTCARKFAEVLMKLALKLEFWQNVPPDDEDLDSVQSLDVPDLVRQAIAQRQFLDARTIGPWLFDVYSGSRKKESCGNKWDDPYPYFYAGQFADSGLPLPLMKDFRANRAVIIQTICKKAIEELSPRKRKSGHIGTQMVNCAAKQAASGLRAHTQDHLSQRKIEYCLEQLKDGTEASQEWRRPIDKIIFVPSERTESELGEKFDYDVLAVIWSSERYTKQSHFISVEGFARKVGKILG